MNSNRAILPPLDPNVASANADADEQRRKLHLRMLLAEGYLSPSRRRMIEFDLRAIEREQRARKDA